MYRTQALHRCLQQSPDAPATIFGERVSSHRVQTDQVAWLAGTHARTVNHCASDTKRSRRLPGDTVTRPPGALTN
jgi:hypothetical protein